jgi:hypothetical protein
MSAYPVGYEVDFQLERSRLTTFFRYFMVIPQYLVGIVYGIGVLFALIIAWFALLITARYPEGLYNFVAGVVRWSSRVSAYGLLVTDVYPPFDLGEHPEYPIRVPIGPPLEKYSRLKVFFRWILGIPVMLISYALSILASICAVLAWFVIVFTGKQNEGLQNGTTLGTAYSARSGAYFMYLTEDWPPFSQEGVGPAMGPPSPAPQAPAVPAEPETPQPPVT